MCSKARSASGGKICITSQGNTLHSKIDPRFGRCQYFIIIQTDTMQFEAIENPNIDSSGGAGIVSGQLVSSKGVKSVLTGNIGPNAFQTLKAAGIDIITGLSGTVKEALERYTKGQLSPTKAPTVDRKFGTGGV